MAESSQNKFRIFSKYTVTLWLPQFLKTGDAAVSGKVADNDPRLFTTHLHGGQYTLNFVGLNMFLKRCRVNPRFGIVDKVRFLGILRH
jgi:hypothetical protein